LPSSMSKLMTDGDQETASPAAPGQQLALSAIVPVTERFDPIGALITEYLHALRSIKEAFELICVVEASYRSVLDDLTTLKQAHPEVKIIVLSRSFSEATAITVAFDSTKGQRILLLPAYHHIIADDIPELFKSASEADVIVGRRNPRQRTARGSTTLRGFPSFPARSGISSGILRRGSRRSSESGGQQYSSLSSRRIRSQTA